MSSRRSSWSLVVALTGTAFVAACSHRDAGTQTAGTKRDLTLASHGSVSQNLAIAPDEIFGTRNGRSTSTVRRRMLVHEASGRELAAAATPAIVAPAAPTVVAVAPVPAPAMSAEPRPGHVAVVGSLAGDAAARPDPSADPSGNGPYSGDLGGVGAGGWGGPVIRGGGIGDDDHCERRPPRGIMGGAGLNPVF